VYTHIYNNTNFYFVYDESRLIVTQHRYFRYPSIYQPSIRGMVMVWLPWQCSSALEVSADWLSSILSPHSGGRRVARGLEREELLLRPRAAGKHADQFGARPGRDIWALGPLPQGAKVSSQSVPFPFILHSVRNRHSPLSLPLLSFAPRRALAGIRKLKVGHLFNASAIALQGLAFTSYFCHHHTWLAVALSHNASQTPSLTRASLCQMGAD